MFIAKRKFSNTFIRVSDQPISIERSESGLIFKFEYFADHVLLQKNLPLKVDVFLGKTISDVEGLLNKLSVAKPNLTAADIPKAPKQLLVSKDLSAITSPEKAKQVRMPLKLQLPTRHPQRTESSVSTKLAIERSAGLGLDYADVLRHQINNSEVENPAGIDLPPIQNPTQIEEVVSEYLTFTLPADAIEGNVFTFSVSNFQGLPIQIQQVEFSKSDLAEYFRNTLAPPRVSYLALRGDGYGFANVEQTDSAGTRVLVYRRVLPLDHVARTEYQLMADMKLGFKEAKRIKIDSHDGSNVSYRFLTADDFGNLSADFSSFVVDADRPNKSIGSIALYTTESESGTNVFVENIPSTAVSCTLYAQEGTNRPSDALRLVSSGYIYGAAKKYFLDGSSKDKSYRFYRLIVSHRTGLQTEHVSVAEKCIRKKVGVGSIKIDSLSNEDGNVTFSISTELEKNENERLRSILTLNGYAELFKEETQNERSLLSRVISHKVFRINTKTGEVVDFGLVDRDFNDKERSKTIGASSVVANGGYKYQIFSCIRAPETLFNDYKKTSKDSTTGRNYQWKPAESLHPLATHDGVKSSKDARSRFTSYSEMDIGATGISTDFDITIPKGATRIASAIEKQISVTQALLKVSFLENASSADHYQVIENSQNGIKSVARIFPVAGQTSYSVTIPKSKNSDFYIYAVTDEGIGDNVKFEKS